jgi:uncharacterized protein YutE (UPF0331/DUF86 family)
LEYDDLLRLADVSPRAAILEAWLRVESALAEMAIRMDVSTDTRRSPLNLIGMLERYGAIAPEVGSALRRLRNLSNVAVHTQDLDISKDTVVDYIDTANFILRSLRERPTDVE